LGSRVSAVECDYGITETLT